MARANVLQEVRRMQFEELYVRRPRRELAMAEVAELLGVTERTFRRWSARYEVNSVEGLEDRRLGRASAWAVPVDETRRMVTVYATHYTDWSMKHVHERWCREHEGHTLPYVDDEPAATGQAGGASCGIFIGCLVVPFLEPEGWTIADSMRN
ncbi:MAG: helix-turn-helix domain-containing protein [Nitrospira sp.]|nr:helix-turn-helix domain-containing protein [Nitrospira sp.]